MKKIFQFFFVLFFGTVSAQQNLLNGLQACYPLDCAAPPNNAASTGAVLNGLLFGNVTCTVGHTNQSGTAMKFGGTAADYIALPSNSMIKPTTSITVSGWYFVTSTAHQDIIFTKNLCSINFNGYNLISDGGQFLIVKKPGTAGSCNSGLAATSAVYPVNVWHHVVFYIDNTKSMITVDNTAPVTVPHSILFEYDPVGEVIVGGTNELAANSPYYGSIDDLRFYNRQLTAGQIDSLYNQNPSCVATPTIASPTASFTPKRPIICVGESVMMTNLSSTNSVSYQWQTPGGSPATSTLVSPTITYTAAGTYTVILTASNSGGASSPYTTTISVKPCLSISESEFGEEVVLFPNPSDGLFSIRGIKDATVYVKTVTGQEVYSGIIQNDEMIDLRAQPAGVYFVSVKMESGSMLHGRLVVAK